MIRAEVIYTGEYLRDSHFYNGRKQIILWYVMKIIEIVFLTILTVWGLYYCLHSRYANIIIIAAVLNTFSVISGIKKIIKELGRKKELENTPPAKETREYFFGEDMFTFIKRGADTEIKREFAYPDLHAATETNKYFYIHLYRNLVCIIGKNDITEGSASELRELLISKMVDRFLIDTEGSV